MDPVTAIGLVASLAQLIDATTKVLGYLNDVKNAPRARGRLSLETANVLTLLIRLHLRVEDARSPNQVWFSSLKALTEPPSGALIHLEDAYRDLTEKLKPSSSITVRLRWHFDKKDVDSIQGRIKRAQDMISLALQDDTLQFLQAIKEDTAKLSGIESTMRNASEAHSEAQKAAEFQEICEFLSPLNFLSKHKDVIASLQKGTGEWFLEGRAFQEWIGGIGTRLWCPGIPGAGKTVLSALAFNNLKSRFLGEADTAVICIFCDYAEKDSQTAAVLLASIWRQLATLRGEITQNARDLYRVCSEGGTPPTCRQIYDLVISQLGVFHKIFIIVDALDECAEEPGREHRSVFLQQLLDLSNLAKVNLLVTSRPNDDVLQTFHPDFSITIEAYQPDIALYVRGRLSQGRRLLRNIQKDPSLENDIVSTIVAKSQDMFLLARLHMDSLSMAITPGSARRILSDLPSSYSTTYGQTMNRIAAQYPEDVRLAYGVLSWTTFSLRPLTVDELRQALSVRREHKDIDVLEFPDEELLTAVCAGLVIIDHETRMIRLVHKTTQEFFIKNGSKTYFQNLNNTFTSVCISYLRFDRFRSGPSETQEQYDEFLRKYKFYTYAARFWGDHARGQSEDDLQDEIKAFLVEKPKVMTAIQSRNVGSGNSSYDLYPGKVTTLAYLAGFGLSRLATRILESHGTEGINLKDSFGATPLLRAAEAGHLDVVTVFLENGADPNISGPSGITPLIAAASGGFDLVVRALLEHKADPEAKSYGWTTHGTALSVAIEQGHAGVINMLLGGIDVTHPDPRRKGFQTNQAISTNRSEPFRPFISEPFVASRALGHTTSAPAITYNSVVAAKAHSNSNLIANMDIGLPGPHGFMDGNELVYLELWGRPEPSPNRKPTRERNHTYQNPAQTSLPARGLSPVPERPTVPRH